MPLWTLLFCLVPRPAWSAEPLPASAVDPDGALYGMRGVDHACAICQDLEPGNLARVSATSQLAGGERYAPGRALDGDMATAWCEGAEGPGLGQRLRIELKAPRMLEAVGVYGGYFKSEALLADNARLRSFRLRTDSGVDQAMRLADPSVPMAWDPSISSSPDQAPLLATEWFARARDAEVPRHTVLRAACAETPPLVQWIELELVEAWPGRTHADLCVSEIQLLLIDPAEL